ncbi:MAG: hypothetical protein L0Z73_12165 [Gammaproteobacteria bacterium]|nr:hypothetical protein [Gammaproteobacteria bacterium]
MEIDKSWIPTLLCIINDSIKYNDSLRNSQTVKDVEDIEDWMLSIYQFKGYLEEEIKKDSELYARCEKYLSEL